MGHHVGGEDPRGARELANRDRHQPDRPAPQDRDRGGCDVLHECGEHRIPHRFLDRRDLGREPFAWPGVAFRQAHVLGERALGIHAEDPQVGADVLAPRPALVAGPVHEVRLGGDARAQRHGTRSGSVGDDSTGHFVAKDARQMPTHSALRPLVPAIYVQIGAAQRHSLEADQQLPGSGARDGYFPQLGACLGSDLHQRSHRLRDAQVDGTGGGDQRGRGCRSGDCRLGDVVNAVTVEGSGAGRSGLFSIADHESIVPRVRPDGRGFREPRVG